MVKLFRRPLKKLPFHRILALFLLLGCLGAGFLTYQALSKGDPLVWKPNDILLLLNLDLLLLLSLGVLVARRLVKIWAAHRAGRAGSRLHVTFVGLFGLLTLVPTVTVTFISILFLNQGIQAWFSQHVRVILEQSTEVAQAYLKEHQKVIMGSAEAMARDIAHQYQDFRENPEVFDKALEAFRLLRGLDEALVFDGSQIIARSMLSFSLQFERLSEDLLNQSQEEPVLITSQDHERVRALVKIPDAGDVYLLVGRFIDPKVQGRMVDVANAVSSYNRLDEQKDDLQLKFSMVFVLLCLLLILGALWMGLTTASRLARPIISLIEGAEAVRQGNYEITLKEKDTKDELSMLLKAFNRMTRQLFTQRQELLEANQQLHDRRQIIENVLEGVKASVVGVDAKGCIVFRNKSAQDVLFLSPGDMLSKKIPEAFDVLKDVQNRSQHFYQTQIILNQKGFVRTFLLRTVLRDQNKDSILTFDDITDLVSAQKNEAWRDVAKRIAHEIKNPLTPIQLSADRLRRRYQTMIPGEDDVFHRCLDTIVRHVDLIRTIVSEFSSFARMPAPKMGFEDLGKLMDQTVFMQQSAHSDIEIQCQRPKGPVMMTLDSNQIQQVFTNLFQNAIESIQAKRQKTHADDWAPRIRFTLKKKPGVYEVSLWDNGEGLPKDRQENLFDPYITNKEKGTGLGLAIVKKIIEDHEGTIQLENHRDGGAVAFLVFKVPHGALPNESKWEDS